MRKLKTWGSSKGKAESAQGVSSQPPSAQWAAPAPAPAQSPSQPAQASHPNHAHGHSNLSDDELRAMEESALEYAIAQSQQQPDST